VSYSAGESAAPAPAQPPAAGPSFALLALLIGGAVFLSVFAGALGQRSGIPSNMTLDDVGGEGSTVIVRAHSGGLFAQLFGLQVKATLTATPAGVSLHLKRPGAASTTRSPASHLANLTTGRAKPLSALVFGVLFVLLGLLALQQGQHLMGGIGLALGVCAIIYYRMTTYSLIIFETTGGGKFGIRLRSAGVADVDSLPTRFSAAGYYPSVIEG